MGKASKKEKEGKIWDVVVIGGGPAGMIAAIEAAKRGREVLLLEKNEGLGKKLLITGGGRCNVTNNKPVVREMLSQYKEAGKYLFSTFMQYGVKETIEFFEAQGLPFIEENEGRLFPATQKAESVYAVLEQSLKEARVTIETKSAVQHIFKTENFVIELVNGKKVLTQNVVVATGGTARPETGSTGDAYAWLAKFGHKIHTANTALVPITVKESWVSVVSGVSLPIAKIVVYVDGKKRLSVSGKLLFTHVGLSGPLILNQSATIGDLLTEGEVIIKIDTASHIDAGIIQAELLKLYQDNPNKKIKNILGEIIPTALVEPVLETISVDGEDKANSLRAADRKRLGVVIKALPVTVTGLLGSDKAVATAGGVDLSEVDFKTMQSKIVPGLYLIGDVLDINRPSGGYSLQLCWSTGYVAGKNI